MIRDFYDYRDEIPLICELSAEQIPEYFKKIPGIYQDVLMNCLDPEERSMILADIISFMLVAPAHCTNIKESEVSYQ